MSANKSLAFALCLTVTGCAQFGQGPSADASAKPSNPAAQVVAGQAESPTRWYWPFGSDHGGNTEKPELAATKPESKPETVAKADGGSHWWWPFGKGAQDEAKPVQAAALKVDPKLTQAWLDDYEPKLRAAIADSPFQIERRDDVLVVTAPVDASFNPDRPAMLLPVVLSPITKLAKAVEGDQKTAVLVLGHADSTGAVDTNKTLSQQRAQSVAAIFRLSGLERNRLSLRGMGSVMPRAANDSASGRALNRRVEVIMTPQATMSVLMAKYDLPPTPTLLAQEVKPAAPAVEKKTEPAKKAAPAKKASTAKAPVKKAAPAKKATTKSATPAKAAAKKSDAQASAN